jgi:hypothetical protein
VTRVRTSAEQAEVTALERERDREAWNLPRQPPVTAKIHASPGSQESVPRDKLDTGPSRTTVLPPEMSRSDHDTTGQDLDWEGFLAAYFPGSLRHNLKALAAYGAYKRSRLVDRQSTTEAVHLKEGAIAETATSVEAWENEGGSSQ